MSHPRRNKPDLTSGLQPGARVMIRRRLSADETRALAGTPDAGTTLTDVVGTVTALDAEAVTVSTRRGIVRVQRGGIVTAKQIPPARGRRISPHRAIGVSELEELMVDGWAPSTSQWMGRWLLREAGGYTGRANSCLVLGDADRPLPDALDATRAWYARHDAPPLIHLPLTPGQGASADPLVAEAEGLGWEWFQHTLVMTAATQDVLVSSAGSPLPSATPHLTSPNDGSPGDRSSSDGRIVTTHDLDDAWWALADERMRRDETSARRVLTSSPEQVFVTAFTHDEPVARGRLAVGNEWGGIFAVATRDDVRGQGLGSAVMRACAEVAAERGIGTLYLQVSSDNDAAVALYGRLGFTTHHPYVYLRPRR